MNRFGVPRMAQCLAAGLLSGSFWMHLAAASEAPGLRGQKARIDSHNWLMLGAEQRADSRASTTPSSTPVRSSLSAKEQTRRQRPGGPDLSRTVAPAASVLPRDAQLNRRQQTQQYQLQQRQSRELSNLQQRQRGTGEASNAGSLRRGGDTLNRFNRQQQRQRLQFRMERSSRSPARR